MRGTMSIAMAVTPLAFSVSSSSGFCAGQRKLIRVWPARAWSISAASGGADLGDDVGLRPEIGGGRHDRRRPPRRRPRPRSAPRAPAPALDQALVAELLQRERRLRGQRDALFALEDLPGGADLHGLMLLCRAARGRRCGLFPEPARTGVRARCRERPFAKSIWRALVRRSRGSDAAASSRIGTW